MLVGTAKDCSSVGQAGAEHTKLVQDVISELVSAVSAKEGITFKPGSIERLAGKSALVLFYLMLLCVHYEVIQI